MATSMRVEETPIAEGIEWQDQRKIYASPLEEDQEPRVIQHGVYETNGASGMNKHLKSQECKKHQQHDLRQSIINLERKFELVQEKLLHDLPLDGRASLTLDAWTSPNHLAFLGIIGSFVTSKWKRKEVLLAFTPLSGTHHGASLADHVFRVLETFQIESRLLAITADNASNNKTLCSSLSSSLQAQKGIFWSAEQKNLPCLAHVIQLVAKEVVNSLRIEAEDSPSSFDDDSIQGSLSEGPDTFRNTINKIRRIAKAISASPQRREQFENLQSRNPPLQMVQDVTTRWNSTYSMAIRALLLKKHIIAFLDQSDNIKFRDLYLADDDFGIFYAVTSVLDPTQRMNAFHEDDWSKDERKVQKSRIIQFYADNYLQFEPPMPQTEEDRDGSSIEDLNSLFSHSSKLMAKNPTRQNEMERYLSDQPTVSPDHKICILDHWQAISPMYPTVARMARDLLAIFLTSVPTERQFSSGRDICHYRRSKLQGPTIEKIMILKHALPEFGSSIFDDDISAEWDDEGVIQQQQKSRKQVATKDEIQLARSLEFDHSMAEEDDPPAERTRHRQFRR
ncbi:HAT dimerization [Penicillium maclennaniae]|uniref:HAT dimerization n=1 Tax=Penicillium maclennaniae TaxID=1343394 RepID=UPI0025401D29|nr:HAT dimerization [Penicillium maclennaniae]KAJ5666156.1 HAT dimerization [Penicillium maclennaniae]